MKNIKRQTYYFIAQSTHSFLTDSPLKKKENFKIIFYYGSESYFLRGDITLSSVNGTVELLLGPDTAVVYYFTVKDAIIQHVHTFTWAIAQPCTGSTAMSSL
jgi:hypothetical protein